MSNFIINGGHKLKGEIRTNAAKNSAVAILSATAMIKGKTTLVNVPVIEEVKRIIEILVSLGMEIEWSGEHELTINNPGNLNPDNINHESFIKTRSGLLLMGALANDLASFKLPQASGCRLGKRTVNPYTIAMEHLGFRVDCEEKFYCISRQNNKGKEFTMYEMGDTATENTILAAVRTPGKTIMHFASSNYMTQDLCYFLIQARAKIEGIGTPTITIEGVKKLKPVKNYPIMLGKIIKSLIENL